MAQALEIPKVAQQWVLAEFPPPGLPEFGKHVVKRTVDLPAELKDGEVLVRVTHLTVDPYQRGVMNPVAYGIKRELGTPVSSGASGVVVASKHEAFPVGTSVEGGLGWVDAAVCRPEEVQLRALPAEWSRSHALGVLGMPGATAILSVEDNLKPEAGQVVFVSGASGAVGGLVGQLCKLKGCTVYGSVGSDDKIEHAKALGFDGVLNYKGKTAAQLLEEIQELTGGKKIDRYYDNTGGPVTDAVAAFLNRFARITICGQIATYNETPERMLAGGEGISSALFTRLLLSEASAKGFLIFSYPDWNPSLHKLHQLIVEGKLEVLEDFSEGFDQVPEAWLSLYNGRPSSGKKVVKL